MRDLAPGIVAASIFVARLSSDRNALANLVLGRAVQAHPNVLVVAVPRMSARLAEIGFPALALSAGDGRALVGAGASVTFVPLALELVAREGFNARPNRVADLIHLLRGRGRPAFAVAAGHAFMREEAVFKRFALFPHRDVNHA